MAAPEMSVRDAGTWKPVDKLHVRDAGVWKEVQDAFVRDAAVHKQFHNAFTLTVTCVPATCVKVAFDPANALVTLTANATVDWEFTVVSGSATTGTPGPSTGTTLTRSGIGTATYDIKAIHAGSGQEVTKRVTVNVETGL